jgi:hypothetical protein
MELDVRLAQFDFGVVIAPAGAASCNHEAEGKAEVKGVFFLGGVRVYTAS